MARASMRYLLLLSAVWLTGCTSTLNPFPNTEEHIVARNESLYAIAWRHEVDFRDLAKWNGLSKPYKIYPGQRLVLHPFGGGPKRRPTVQPESQPEKPRAPSGLTTTAAKKSPTQTARVVEPSPQPVVKPVTPGAASASGGETAGAAGTTAKPASGAAGTTQDEPKSGEPEKSVQVAKAEPPKPPPPVTKPEPVTPVIERPVRTRNGWAWPTAGKPSETYKQTGTGLTIPGQKGQSVHAARSGKVVYAGGGLKGYGLLVIIKHSDEYLTAYGHNDRLLVVQGEDVKVGQRIATMGLGPENSSQLHFELRRDGRPVDPMRVLPAPD